MLDSVGSAAVESLAEHVNDLLCQAAIAEGIRVTNRISPGYAGWDTAQQRELFRLCPGTSIGVLLNEACFMTPVKTISFLVGIGPEARVDHYFSQCARCWMADCAFRCARRPTGIGERPALGDHRAAASCRGGGVRARGALDAAAHRADLAAPSCRRRWDRRCPHRHRGRRHLGAALVVAVLGRFLIPRSS